MKTYPTKWYSSEMQGAPQHTLRTEKQLITTLKALLVTGFGSLVPDSIVFDSTLSYAKATFGSGHKYLKDSVILVSGASPSNYNGEHKVMKVSTNEVWFELNDEPESSASGAMLIKYPALGWSISHENAEGTKAIFTPLGDVGNVSLLVDNSPFTNYNQSYTWSAKVIMVSDVVDINNYTLEDREYYCYWMSCSDDVNFTNAWKMVGTDQFFNYMVKGSNQDRYSLYQAGYFKSFRQGDRYNFMTNGGSYITANYSANTSMYRGSDAGNNYNLVARSYSQLLGWCHLRWLSLNSDISSSSYGCLSPNPVDNGFYIQETPVIIAEGTPLNTSGYLIKYNLRGEVPIYREVLTNLSAYNGKVISKNDKDYLCISCSTSSTNSSDSTAYDRLAAFDITPVEV